MTDSKRPADFEEWRKQQLGFYPFDIPNYPRRQERAAEIAFAAGVASQQTEIERLWALKLLDETEITRKTAQLAEKEAEIEDALGARDTAIRNEAESLHQLADAEAELKRSREVWMREHYTAQAERHRLEGKLARYEAVVEAVKRYKESVDAWAGSESPLEINPLTGSVHFRRSPELSERDQRWAKVVAVLAMVQEDTSPDPPTDKGA